MNNHIDDPMHDSMDDSVDDSTDHLANDLMRRLGLGPHAGASVFSTSPSATIPMPTTPLNVIHLPTAHPTAVPLLTTPSGAVYSLEHFEFSNSLAYRRYVEQHQVNSIPTIEIDISNPNASAAYTNGLLEYGRALALTTISGYHNALRKFGYYRTANLHQMHVILGYTAVGDVYLYKHNLRNLPDTLPEEKIQDEIVGWVMAKADLPQAQVSRLLPFFRHSIHGIHASRIIHMIMNTGSRDLQNSVVKGPIYATLGWLGKWASEFPAAYAVVVTIKVSTANQAAILSLLDPVPPNIMMMGGAPLIEDMRDMITNWQFSTENIETLCPPVISHFVRLNRRLFVKLLVE